MASILEKYPNHIEALFLQFQSIKKSDSNKASNLITEIIVSNTSFLPAYIERLHLCTSTDSWDLIFDYSRQLSLLDPDSIDSIALVILHDITRGKSNINNIVSLLTNLHSLIMKIEPSDATLLYYMKPFLRLSNRNIEIVGICARFVEMALMINQSHEAKAEMAYIHEIQGEYKKAIILYEEAHESPHAVEGLIRCLIKNGDFQGARDNLEMFGAGTRESRFVYLQSLISWHFEANIQKKARFLKQCVEEYNQLAESSSGYISLI